MNNKDMPAMPIVNSDGFTGDPNTVMKMPYGNNGTFGLTKLEYFTAKAMQGLIGRWVEGGQTFSDIISEQAVEIAKATLKALEESE